MRRLNVLVPLTALALVVAAAAPAGAAEQTSVNGLSATASGTAVSVQGSATLGGQDPIVVGEDPPGDNAGGAATAPFGLDFTGFSISQPDPTKGNLLFTIGLAELTGGGIPEGIQYNWDIMVDGGADFGGSNWSLKTMRSRAITTGNLDPDAAIFDCQPNEQTGGFTCSQVQTIPVEYDSSASEIRMTVPVAAIGAQPGSMIEAWGRATNPLWIGPSAGGQLTFTNVFDTGSHDPYVVPRATVRLGIAPAGQPIDHTVNGTLAPDGSFSGELTAPGPGTYDVGAQVCFGSNCDTASTPVTV